VLVRGWHPRKYRDIHSGSFSRFPSIQIDTISSLDKRNRKSVLRRALGNDLAGVISPPGYRKPSQPRYTRFHTPRNPHIFRRFIFDGKNKPENAICGVNKFRRWSSKIRRTISKLARNRQESFTRGRAISSRREKQKEKKKEKERKEDDIVCQTRVRFNSRREESKEMDSEMDRSDRFIGPFAFPSGKDAGKLMASE